MADALSSLFDRDLLDVLFENKEMLGAFSTGTLNVSLHSGKSPHVYNQPIENLHSLGEVKLAIESNQAVNLSLGETITLRDYSNKDKDFTIMGIKLWAISAELTLIPMESPQPIVEDPVVETHVDYPEVEECALDIDVELGISRSEM